MAHSTMEAFEYVRHLDYAGKIADSPSEKTQKFASALLRDAIQIRDFAAPIAARASKSSDRSADISWNNSNR